MAFPPNINVLVIDDNVGDLRLLEEYLQDSKRARFSVIPASTGKEGLEKMESTPIQVALLDYILPNEFSEDILTALTKKETPVIMVTGSEDADLGRSLIRRGAQDFVSKADLNSSILERAILHVIERYRLIRERDMERQKRLEEVKNERDEVVRNYHHLVAMSGERESPDKPALADLDPAILEGLRHDYQEIVKHYIQSKCSGEERPFKEMKDFAMRLASLSVRARHLVGLHIFVLNRFAERATPTAERAFTNDARLALVELMGTMMDIYADGGMTNEELGMRNL